MDYLNRIQPFGIKLQLLHVLKDTDLADDYLAGKFEVLTFDAYIDLVHLLSRPSFPRHRDPPGHR